MGFSPSYLFSYRKRARAPHSILRVHATTTRFTSEICNDIYCYMYVLIKKICNIMCHYVTTDAEFQDIVSDPMSELLPGE